MLKSSKLFDNLLFYILIFLFIFIPLYPKFPLINIKGTFVAIRIEDFLIAFSLLVWGFYILLSGQVKLFFKDKLNQAILVFFFIGLVSSFSALFVTHTVEKSLVFFNFLRRIELMMLLPLAFSVVKTKKRLEVVLITLSTVVLVINIYAIGQQYLGWKVISTSNSEFAKGQILNLTPGGRVNSTFAGQYDLAIFLAMVLSLVAALFFYFKKLWLRVWQIVLAILSFFVLILTAARLSFFAALVGVIASIFLVGQKKVVFLIVVLALIALASPSQLRQRLIDTVTVNIAQGGQRYTVNSNSISNRGINIPTLSYHRAASDSASQSASVSSLSGKLAPDLVPGEPIDTTQLGVYRSLEIRFKVEWPRAIRALVKNPLLGTGYSSLGVATDNDILRSLGEVGFLGTISFIMIIVVITKRLVRLYCTSHGLVKFVSAGVLSMVVAYLINTVFIDAFEASKIAALFWLITGSALALYEKTT